ncbi:MAG TPA: XdhC family protein [Acidobacteriaceae bacterium]|jgi:xanthine/CO dehydrogenase XdhC/CoxF family maturation factor|nr:XdhC family protein [Acidobacteriaceae bacterium]
MSELKNILELWKSAQAAGDAVCLATVVGVQGSAYRRPGARMLLTSAGRRAGTVSGGCLEAEIAKKAWWLTEQGPSVQRYSSFFDDDGDLPYGLGCGGTVVVLLERGAAAEQHLDALRSSVEERTASVIVTSTDTNSPGTVLVLDGVGTLVYGPDPDADVIGLARETLATRQSRHAGGFFVEFVAPPPSLLIFGAGDDAQPLVAFAATLGWHVTVADGRSQLARAERFPQAARVCGLQPALAAAGAEDAAVLMTHSYEQDALILRALLRPELLGRALRYLGVLGPRRRTERLVEELAEELGLTVEAAMARLHSPVGLDLGGHAPATIALSIAAELQAIFAGRPALSLQGQPVIA